MLEQIALAIYSDCDTTHSDFGGRRDKPKSFIDPSKAFLSRLHLSIGLIYPELGNHVLELLLLHLAAMSSSQARFINI